MVWRSPLIQRRVLLAFLWNVAEAILIRGPFSRQPRGVLLALRMKRRKNSNVIHCGNLKAILNRPLVTSTALYSVQLC